ncbi:Hypothetical protein FKW44_025192 [Caligus rogercresseyi]|uniref:Uncharacterized protein n=1 Tax=Caligus rogercresseyi TaxID=217165 RepID=A0A7T8JT00_CALRO|nr:Hypothetical protein FKW44_025192 [Caligus rogercresseyi]
MPEHKEAIHANEALKEAKEALMAPNKRVEVPRLSPTSPTLLDYGTPLEDLQEEQELTKRYRNL